MALDSGKTQQPHSTSTLHAVDEIIMALCAFSSQCANVSCMSFVWMILAFYSESTGFFMLALVIKLYTYNLYVCNFTVHFTLYSLHCALHTLLFTLCTSHFTLYTVHFTLYSLHCALHTLLFTLCTRICFDLCSVHAVLVVHTVRFYSCGITTAFIV